MLNEDNLKESLVFVQFSNYDSFDCILKYLKLRKNCKISPGK